jgi:hypothetical protein
VTTFSREAEDKLIEAVSKWIDGWSDLLELTTDLTWGERTTPDDLPSWVRKVASKLAGTLFAPVTTALDELEFSPYRVGYAMGIMQWGNSEMSAKPSPELEKILRRVKISPRAKRKVSKLFEQFFLRAGLTPAELRRSRFIPPDFKSYLAKVERGTLKDVREFHRGMVDGLEGVGKGVSRDQSNLATDIYLALAMWWRIVISYTSVTELHQWLTRILGEQRVGDRKRVEKICERIGLRFREPGRPPKNPTLVLPG